MRPAVLHVALGHPAGMPELLEPLVDEFRAGLVSWRTSGWICRLRSDLVEIGRHHRRGVGVGETELPAPQVEVIVRCAGATGRIDHRRATHAGALQNRDVAVGVGLATMVLVQGAHMAIALSSRRTSEGT